MGHRCILPLLLATAMSGCASVTTKVTGSPRAGAEQLLLTGISDRAIGSIDFRPLAGRHIYLDATRLSTADSGWVTFSLRREMSRQGLLLVSDNKNADTIVEASVAAYGTDEADRRFSLPSTIPLGMMPISTGVADASGLFRKSKQDAVVKVALFAYEAKTGQFVWESGTIMEMGHLDRRFCGTANITRDTSLPELESYPPRTPR